MRMNLKRGKAFEFGGFSFPLILKPGRSVPFIVSVHMPSFRFHPNIHKEGKEMNKRMIFGLLGLAFLVGLGVAQDLVPVAVSPGAENGPAVVRQSCPTFSWTAVSWALTYKVVVFEATDGEAPAYEKIAANAAPVLVKEIPGKAFSWTPSADEPLINGGSYVWYVGAMVNAAQGSWSEGRKFIIAESPAWGVVSEPRKDGIGAGDSRQILRDKDLEMTAAAEENFTLTDDPMNQGLIGIEGTETGNNTFYGANAGNTTMTGAYNSFFGNLAGNKNTTGAANTFLGTAAGYLNTKGTNNIFVGRSAGQHNTTASYNTFVGYAAGYVNTTGTNNTFVGNVAGQNNTSGRNTFVGSETGTKNTDGWGNSFFGSGAGYNNTNGDYNTLIGEWAGHVLETGYDNVFVGDFAGSNNTSGAGNVFIGNEAGQIEMGSNKLYIDNTSTTTPLIYGDFSTDRVGINNSSPGYTFVVGTGGAHCDGTTWVNGSSREFKENIQELTSQEALQAFADLEPVKFNYKENKEETYLGFIAEDVPDLVAMNDRKGLNPMDLVAMLTKVVQEQQKALLEQQKSITELREEIAQLKKEAEKEK
jgi:hypothetical protein